MFTFSQQTVIISRLWFISLWFLWKRVFFPKRLIKTIFFFHLSVTHVEFVHCSIHTCTLRKWANTADLTTTPRSVSVKWAPILSIRSRFCGLFNFIYIIYTIGITSFNHLVENGMLITQYRLSTDCSCCGFVFVWHTTLT